MRIKKYKKAFTLVEIIVGLSVLGTMYAFSTASYKGYRDMSQREQQKLDIQQVKNAVDNYYAANSKYPTSPLEKQPSPDVKDSSGKVTFKGYSKIDLDLLVDERYLQSIPSVDKGKYFAVSYNGVVSIEEGISESIVVENGSIIIPAKSDNTIAVDVYTAKNATSIKVSETDKNYTSNISGVVDFASKSSTVVDDMVKYSGSLTISATPGQKYLKADVTYRDGSTVSIRATIQYALSSDQITDNPYWINPSDKSNSTDNVNISSISKNDTNASVVLDWTNNEVYGGAMVIKYEINKYEVDNRGNKTLTLDSPIITSNTQYIDFAVKGDTQYEYTVHAYTANITSTGENKKTSNALVGNVVTGSYVNTDSYIDNITKNDFNTAYNKEIAVRVGDKEGVRKVTLYIAQVKDGAITSEGFRAYEMNKTKDGTSTIVSNGEKLVTDVYTVPVEIKDDYMVYYIKVTDNRGYELYNYYDPTVVQNSGESTSEYDARKSKTSANRPTSENNYFTLIRGMIEIYSDNFADNTGIDDANSSYHLFDGKVSLP